ncbi:S-norcoclaurine synthase 2 [Sesamum alatum]|uniref:S-norcoclaurine synthase 2 n=1 Tax=Sesamum alatum TaxID=300844 RepID=A0AAE1YTY6_9LAMI|nr:S-norcoclaurine synthase 2 [Sesamum alatum]
MEGTVWRELEVKVPASETWKVYGSLQLAKLGVEELPDRYSGFKVLKGNGYAGTVIQVFFAPGTPGPAWYKEKFLVVDDEKRVKVGVFTEGGVLEQGFESYVVVLEAIEKEGKKDECVMRGTIEYVLYDEAAIPLVTSSIEGLFTIMKIIAAHVTRNYNNRRITHKNYNNDCITRKYYNDECITHKNYNNKYNTHMHYNQYN